MFSTEMPEGIEEGYIPKMKRNLISVSALDAKGYKYSGGDI